MSLRILLADESSTIKKAFEIGLNSFGAEIKNVQHGIDVLEVADHFKPDIIFADVLISKMNGYEVCSQIKQHPKLGSIPVVLMWSGFMDIDEDKYFTCQADGKIEKPFSAEQLMTVIQSLVQKSIGERVDTKAQRPYFDPEEGTPPTLSQLHKERTFTPPIDEPLAKENKPKLPPVAKRNPADDLLLKEDHPSLATSNVDDFESLGSQESNEDDEFGLDGFQALDLHDTVDINSEENFDFNLNAKSDTEFDDEFKESTQIPTLEEEELLLAKVNEDTNIRHGYGFLSTEMQDELTNSSSESEHTADLQKDLQNNEGSYNFYELSTDNDLNSDYFKEELSLENDDFKNMISKDHNKVAESELENNLDETNTIHRDVEDFHNSDMGMLSSINEIDNMKPVKINPSYKPSIDQSIDTIKSGLKVLSKEDIEKIVQEQAKEIIQSVVWELIPEMSKQMIEKEIKRLLAETENPNS